MFHSERERKNSELASKTPTGLMELMASEQPATQPGASSLPSEGLCEHVTSILGTHPDCPGPRAGTVRTGTIMKYSDYKELTS